MIHIREIDHLVLRVSDLDRMLHFYCEVLGCAIARRQDDLGLVQLRAGRSLIDLVPVTGRLGSAGGAAPGVASTSAGSAPTFVSGLSALACSTFVPGKALPNSSAVRATPTTGRRSRVSPQSGHCHAVSNGPHNGQLKPPPGPCVSAWPQLGHRAVVRQPAHTCMGR